MDEVAQSWACAGVQNTLMVGQARLWCSVDRVQEEHLQHLIFSINEVTNQDIVSVSQGAAVCDR